MKDIRQTLRELGIKPVEGQNFLNSEQVVEALVKAGEIKNTEVLEIGAGTGKITKKLAIKAQKVYALEKDTTISQFLQRKFKENSNVEIIDGDILEYEIPEEIERCVSNPPFQYSSEIIEKLGKKQIQSSLILQEELADKLVAEPGQSEYGYFSIKSQYYFVPVKLQKIDSKHYYPEPEVNTAIVKLYPNKERHGVHNEEEFFQLAKSLFTHKRKKTRNALVDARNILNRNKNELKNVRDELPYSEERVINLSVKQINNLEKEFRKKI